MAKIGYARVSTKGQDPDNQVERLKAEGCARIYVDHGASGTKASRPEWDRCLERLDPGDELYATKLDRFGRSVLHLHKLMQDFRKRDIQLCCLDQAVDTTTPEGRAFFGMLAVFAEFERDLISSRTKDGLKSTTKRGRSGGRGPAFTDGQIEMIRKWRSEGWTIERIRLRGELASKGKPPSRMTVNRAIRNNGIPRLAPGSGRKPTLTPEQLGMVRHWRSLGWAVSDIRDELARQGTKVSTSTVQRVLQMSGDATPAYALSGEQAARARDLWAQGFSAEYIQEKLTAGGEMPPMQAIKGVLPKIDKSAGGDAPNSRKLWTDEERKLVMNRDLNPEHLARLLGRSVWTVRKMRSALGYDQEKEAS